MKRPTSAFSDKDLHLRRRKLLLRLSAPQERLAFERSFASPSTLSEALDRVEGVIFGEWRRLLEIGEYGTQALLDDLQECSSEEFRVFYRSTEGLRYFSRWSESDLFFDALLRISSPFTGYNGTVRATPYAPAGVRKIMSLIESAAISDQDTFVDIGGGIGRAALLVTLITGAKAISIELSHDLVQEGRRISAESKVGSLRHSAGDVQSSSLKHGSIFFMYNPFTDREVLNATLHRIADEGEHRPVKLGVLSIDPQLVLQTGRFDIVQRHRASQALPSVFTVR